MRKKMARDVVLLDTLTAAFESDPLCRWLYPDPATRPEALRANFELTLAHAHERGTIDTDPTGNAVALWTAPGIELLDDPAPFVELLDRWAPMRRDAAIAGMARCAGFARAQDHTLHVLAVHPNHQSQGVAHRLVSPKLRQLDHDGVRAYLESSNEHNLSFYRRCGFALLGEVEVVDGGPVMRPMSREPRTIFPDGPSASRPG
jgi:ribosomal protein S18 acetylase RimI-like enzyme